MSNLLFMDDETKKILGEIKDELAEVRELMRDFGGSLMFFSRAVAKVMDHFKLTLKTNDEHDDRF